MNVFIILSILIIVIGVLLIVATPSVLFKFNWNEKNGSGKDSSDLILLYFALYNKYNLLVYQLNVAQKKKRT